MYVFLCLFLFAFIALHVCRRELYPENFESFSGGKYTIPVLSESVCAIESQYHIKLFKIFDVKKNGPEMNVVFMAADGFAAQKYKATINKENKVKLYKLNPSDTTDNGTYGIKTEAKWADYSAPRLNEMY